MLLAKWTIKATTKYDGLTEHEIEDFMDRLFDELDVDSIEGLLGYASLLLEPYDIDIEVQDG